jgi:hypothetical protein
VRSTTFERNIRIITVLALVSALSIGLFTTTALAKPAPVTKITFKLTDHEVPPGAAVNGSVLVRTRSNHAWVPFAGAPLSVTVDGTQVMSLVTDTAGRATVSYTAAAGGHVMKVIFAGDATHKRARRAQGFAVVASATTVPAAPVLTPTSGLVSVALSWTVPADGGSPISGYRIYRGTTPGGEALLTTVTIGTTYLDTAVTSGVTYYYQVTAVNGDGESVRSVEVSATPS